MSELKQEHEAYINRLEASGAPVDTFDCPYCNAQIKTLSNETNKDWDTLSTCPECEKSFTKVTLANQGGVETVGLY